MKLQSYSIVFALIVIPILLVLTYYIQLQVDTVTLQTEYDTKLLDATYDAMSSFEINTANENLSNVSDALRSIIEASNNVFFNTLSTNLGMSNASKSYVEPYVPALLYALYDGYYIYAPTKVPELLINDKGVALTVGDSNNEQGGLTPKDERYNVVKVEGTEYYKYETDSVNDNDTGVRYDAINIGNNYGQVLYVAKDEATGTALKDGTDILYTPDPEKALLKTKNVLKTYMPYSARYKKKDGNKAYDIVVTYTLDNFITIEGTITESGKSIYYTKSGYLINTKKRNDDNTLSDEDIIKIYINNSDNASLLNNYSESRIQSLIETGLPIRIEIDGQEILNISGFNKAEIDNELVFLNNQNEEIQIKTDTDSINNIAEKINGKYGDSVFPVTDENKTKSAIMKFCNDQINDREYKLSLISSAVYYAKGKLFSDWVQNNFGTIEEGDIVGISDRTEIEFENNDAAQGSDFISKNGIFNFSGSNKRIFDLIGSKQTKERQIGLTEIDDDSSFYTHKLNVIRNSMQYNLNLAMTAYSEDNPQINYAMPIISDKQWEDILSNPTIVAFMQGLNCGLKTYSNYVIVSSSNNEISITPNNIYYIRKDLFNDENSEYHKITCPHLLDQVSGDSIPTKDIISFISKEIKYDKIYNKSKDTNHYWYDHKNLACYYCINDGNYKKIAEDAGDNSGIFKKKADGTLEYYDLVRAYYISLGKERNNLYKPNAVPTSQGFEVLYDDKPDSGHFNYDMRSLKPLKDIDYFEIVFKNILIDNPDTQTVSLELKNENLGSFNTNALDANATRGQTRLLYINCDSINPTIEPYNELVSFNIIKNFIIINGDDNFLSDNQKISYIKIFYK